MPSLPAHFMVSQMDGALYDTRAPDWASKPLRAPYSRHVKRIRTVAGLKATLRAGSSTDLGGYPLYFVCADGEALSFAAVRDNLRQVMGAVADAAAKNWPDKQWQVIGIEINHEDGELFCAHTNERIPAAYIADEDAEQDAEQDAGPVMVTGPVFSFR